MDSVYSFGNLADFVADGVRKFVVYDFDGVFNVNKHAGTPKKAFYRYDSVDRHPNPTYDPKARRKRPTSFGWDSNSDAVVTKYREPKSYEIVWSSEMVADSNFITMKPDVQVVWLTTWREHMDGLVDRMGFKSTRPMFYLPWGNNNYHHGDKVPAFSKFFNNVSKDFPQVSAIWVDDVVHAVDEGVVDRFFYGNFDRDDVQVVCSDADFGISKEQMDAMKNFVEKLSSKTH